MSLLPEQATEHLQDTGSTGLVGSRKLVAVQTFDIGRLTTHPVPIVPSSFVAVSGEGPKGDSNGSGKTTFLSAVSLLLADPQWRLKRDGGFARGLLFSPESAGSGEGGGARRGYIVGVFSDEEGKKLLTVWLRISSQTPYLQMRWVRDLHVAVADTDQERSDQADSLWGQLPAKSSNGAQSMGEFLYGDAPRCLAYLDTSMRPMVASLLSQQMTSMAPDAIGDALIALTGQSRLLVKEQKGRVKYDEAAQELRVQEVNDQNRRIAEAAQLAAIDRRDLARQALTAANRSWELHLAVGLGEREEELTAAAAEREQAQEDVEQAKERTREAKAHLNRLREDTGSRKAAQAAEEERERLHRVRTRQTEIVGELHSDVKQLTEERKRLLRVTDRFDGIGVDQRQAEFERMRERLDSTVFLHRRSVARREEAEHHLEQVRAGEDGTAGEAVRRLRELGVRARGLLDSVVLDQDARPEWEAHLWRFRNSVAVAAGDAEFALRSLQDFPGVSIIRVDGSPDGAATMLLEGVTAPPAFGAFLEAVRSRYAFAHGLDRSHDPDLDEWMLSGFPEPVTGREARISVAESELRAAVRAERQSGRTLTNARRALQRQQELLDIATAAERLEACREELRVAEAEHAEAVTAADHLQTLWTAADRQYTAARIALGNHELLVESAQRELRAAEVEFGRLRRALQSANEKVERVQHEKWLLAWGGDSDSAKKHIARVKDRTERRRTAQDWWNHASSSFLEALTVIRQDRDTFPHALVKLIDTAARSVPEPGRAKEALGTALQPLDELLEECEIPDSTNKTLIATEQEERERNLTTARREVNRQIESLEIIRATVARSIKLILARISDQFDELDRERDGGYGARLDYEVLDPSATGSRWKVNVVPRWQRSPQGAYVSYQKIANGAQVKVFAIQLVLASLLADSDVPGRVLVLDELGNSLGDENRRDVLRELQKVAVKQQVTILGTCQDSVIHDAVRHCGQVLWFNHVSNSEVYNRPTRSWGSDENGRHVEHLAFWLRSGRAVD
ncbi:hypothetical protein [Nocardiopsis sp. NRRL B-16309]|uniref:hypothetical protein n=1 Tax=Nocardiopsis sp. NRRL B-16309 TaxID=1519494 RepID=UPI0006AE7CA3|nr:hypothetical protein [Nocardiopsis sp. NRRL B-16309]